MAPAGKRLLVLPMLLVSMICVPQWRLHTTNHCRHPWRVSSRLLLQIITTARHLGADGSNSRGNSTWGQQQAGQQQYAQQYAQQGQYAQQYS